MPRPPKSVLHRRARREHISATSPVTPSLLWVYKDMATRAGQPIAANAEEMSCKAARDEIVRFRDLLWNRSRQE